MLCQDIQAYRCYALSQKPFHSLQVQRVVKGVEAQASPVKAAQASGGPQQREKGSVATLKDNYGFITCAPSYRHPSSSPHVSLERTIKDGGISYL